MLGSQKFQEVEECVLVEEWGYSLISKFLTQKYSCQKEEQGQQMEQRLKEGPSRDCPSWKSTMSANTKPDTLAVGKGHLLTGTSHDGSLGDVASN